MSLWQQVPAFTKLILAILVGLVIILLLLVLMRMGILPWVGLTLFGGEITSLEVPAPEPGAPILQAESDVLVYRTPGKEYEPYGQLGRGNTAELIEVIEKH